MRMSKWVRNYHFKSSFLCYRCLTLHKLTKLAYPFVETSDLDVNSRRHGRATLMYVIIALPMVEINVLAPNTLQPGKNHVSTKLCLSLNVILPGELCSAIFSHG